MEKKESELHVIMRAKDLCSYVIQITEKSPKKYRFTFTSRMQNLCMEIIEDIYLANETFISSIDTEKQFQRRLDYQHSALTKTRVLAYFANLALENKVILSRQFAQISKMTTECQYLLGGWIRKDRERFTKKVR